MKLNKSYGARVAALSLGIALLLAVWFHTVGEPIPLSVMVWPAAGLLIGFAIAFSNVLEESLNLLSLEELPELLEDDVEALKQGRITTEHLYVGATVAALIAELYLLGYYRKWTAAWGPINVLVVALMVVLVAAWVMFRTFWFEDRDYRSRRRMYIIPALGWLTCVSLGVYWAEPVEFGRLSPLERSQLAISVTYWSSTRAGDTLGLFEFVSLDGLSCDDELCIIVAVVLCILGSIAIPHFWVVATLLLLTIMTVITIRELLCREGYRPKNSYSY
jgi:hypothetical protein